MRRRPIDPARRVAFDALRAVHADAAYANLILASLLRERSLPPRDAAFATELLSGTCRMEGTYDLIIAAAAGRKLNSLQPAVLDVLRLGTHQLLEMRVPSHAALAATVDLAAATVGERVTGLTNAILRRVAARDYDGWVSELTAGLGPAAAMAVRTAHPAWIVDAYATLLPAEELAPALAANNLSPEISLAVRPGLAGVDELIDAGAAPGRHSPFAVTWSGNPADLAGGPHRDCGCPGRGLAASHLGAQPRRGRTRLVAGPLRRAGRQGCAADGSRSWGRQSRAGG